MLLFLAIAAVVAVTISSMMKDEARRTVENVVKATVGRIDRMMSEVEAAVNGSVWVVKEHLDDPDYMYRVTENLVSNSRYIIGSTVAFEPDRYPSKGRVYSPYTCLDAKTGKRKSFSLPYDIYASDWYKIPKAEAKPSWCEPYFDEGGGDVMMCTYSLPIFAEDGALIAILTADISLEGLTRYVAGLKPYEDSFAVLKSKKGIILVKPPADVDERRYIEMCGFAENGWEVEVSTPIANVLLSAHKVVGRMLGFSIIGLAMLFCISRFFTRRLQRQEALAARIRGELSVANRIQMGRLVRAFPDYLAAELKPAKEVGGDFYDFVEKDGKLFFAVGDVSGKGVPAALYTFLAGAAFRLAASMGLHAAEIAAQLNALLCEGNDESMFMTFFTGVLDRATGELDFCNAGHNPPILLAPDGKATYLRTRPCLAIGAMPMTRYRSEKLTLAPGARLIVYTDGLTEAENAAHELLGEARLLAAVERYASLSPAGFTDALIGTVRDFAADCEQSDDQTLLVIDTAKAGPETGKEAKTK